MIPRPPDGFGVVLADPPWYFQNRSVKGERKSPARHYRCLPYPDLVAIAAEIGLDFICAENCALVMWATWPLLPQAFDLMAAWGFAYKSGGAWGKMSKTGRLSFGPGYIYRSASEIWLLGTRGAPEIRSHSIRNLILAERREHSRKPDEMYEMIERQFRGPYLEVFARRPRQNWTGWGDEYASE